MNKTDQLRMMLSQGLVNSKAIREIGIPFSLVYALVKRGEAKRISRGIYSSVNVGYSDMVDYETLAMSIPQGVFCLISALRLHNLTDENPHELYIAIKHGNHPPRIDHLPVCFIYRTESQFSMEIETRHSNGVPILVYSLEQTLVDCFKFRNKIGLNVAVSALREAFFSKKVDRNKLWEITRHCRMVQIMRPYLEVFS